jgi:hypothetical protein
MNGEPWRALAPKTWPPLVTGARLPRAVVWRDVALTLLVWVLLALLCRNFLLLVADEFRVATGRDRVGPEFDLLALWQRLSGYVVVVGVLLGVLSFAGLATLRRLRRLRARPLPVPLPPAAEAARHGVALGDLEAWRALRVAVVHVDGQGRMRAEPPS